MWIQVRTIDGSQTRTIEDVSRKATIEELRERVWALFDVRPECQRLFYRGKQVRRAHRSPAARAAGAAERALAALRSGMCGALARPCVGPGGAARVSASPSAGAPSRVEAKAQWRQHLSALSQHSSAADAARQSSGAPALAPRPPRGAGPLQAEGSGPRRPCPLPRRGWLRLG